MSTRTLLLITALLSTIYSETCPDLDNLGVIEVDDLDDCKDIPTGKYASCCLFEYKFPGKEKGRTCVALTDEQVKDHDIFLKTLNEIEAYSELTGTITCKEDNSSYLRLGLFLSILFLLI